MKILSIDIETYSDVDLKKVGVHAYSERDDFEILLFAYAFDEEEVKVVDLANGEMLPIEVVRALLDENIIKTAFNAAFERICISRYLGVYLSPKSWSCTSVQAAMLSLPKSLENVGKVLNLKEQKLNSGKDLIRFFCSPCKETKTNHRRSRNLPYHGIEKWQEFKNYCKRDVEVEREIRCRLSKFTISTEEQELYMIDQEINDRGILIDTDLVKHALECDLAYREKIIRRACEISNISNPNSILQMKNYLSLHNVKANKLDKKSVEKLIGKCDGEVKEVLKLRLLLAKTSIKKYQAIERSICSDDRVHGLFQFYGASRTGRWAGRLVQVQNLPQNHIEDLDKGRQLLKEGKYEKMEYIYKSTPDVLSQLIRTAFIPKEKCEFIVADFSAIEARVLAWISKEKWRIEVFKTHGKIYEASASYMFHVDIKEITKNSDLRQKGKIAELALGYGGSVGALTSMGALEKGIKKDELQILVNRWRNTNPKIVNFWWAVDNAAIRAVKEKREITINKITFKYESGILFIKLPSGRKLSYIKPRLEYNKFGKLSLTYEGIDINKKWSRMETYGPKLVENIVQGISRDILAYAMKNLRNKNYHIVMHVHDEVVLEVKKGSTTVEEICKIMEIVPPWAEDLFLRVDGYSCEYYIKK